MRLKRHVTPQSQWTRFELYGVQEMVAIWFRAFEGDYENVDLPALLSRELVKFTGKS